MDLIRKNRALDTVNDLLIKTLESRNHKELSKVIAKKLKNISESDFCLIGMLDHKKQFEVLALSDTVLSGDDLAQEKERLRKTDLTVFNGWLLPLINNEVVLVNDLANNIANLIFPSFLPESHSLLAIPLSMSDHKFGFVILAKCLIFNMSVPKFGDFRMVKGAGRGGRIDAAQDRAAHVAAAGQQSLRRHVRGDSLHVRMLQRRGGDALPVAQRFADAGDLHMRHRAQHARAHFALETVEHREHGDQYRHAQRDANHRDQRNHRNEARTLPRAGVTQADE